ncbi:ABC transporter permease [Geoglobus acetivorans]|uniref:ABC-2 type transporter transmembrane domain-containing protein n=1 Tax=Geoglobus acetivorans TaxID=565033 RepID=A0A0A7GB29_GEOAI|nr:hypothetical protein GACE_0157 [Geoglobus acetivorans]
MKAMIRKDLRLIVRERTIMSAIAILIFIASFTSVITFGLLVLYKPDSVATGSVRIGVAGNCPVLKSFADERYPELEDALNDFYAGKIDAVLYLPEENYTSANFVTVFLPKNEITGILAGTQVKEILQKYQKAMRERRGIPGDDGFRVYSLDGGKAELREGSSMTFRFIYAILIPLLLITTAIIAGGLVIDLISEEYETRTLDVILSTPMSITDFISAKVFSALIVSAVLSAVWVFLLHVNTGIFRPVLLLILSVSFSMIFASIGAIISSGLKDRERSQLVFSILSVSIVTVSFTHPSMISGVSARISAGSYLQPWEFLIYPVLGSVLMLLSIKFSEKLIKG